MHTISGSRVYELNEAPRILTALLRCVDNSGMHKVLLKDPDSKDGRPSSINQGYKATHR